MLLTPAPCCRLSPRAVAALMDDPVSDPSTPIDKDRLFPFAMHTCRPLMWTPIEIGYDGAPIVPATVSDVVWMYDDDLDVARPLTDAEKRETVLLGCSGRSPGPIHVSWEEAVSAEDSDDATSAMSAPRTFRETVFTDVLTLADLLAIFVKAYADDGSLPPAGMTMRWLMTDVYGRRVHIEFKSHAEVLREEAEIESMFPSQTPSK